MAGVHHPLAVRFALTLASGKSGGINRPAIGHKGLRQQKQKQRQTQAHEQKQKQAKKQRQNQRQNQRQDQQLHSVGKIKQLQQQKNNANR